MNYTRAAVKITSRSVMASIKC